MPKATTSKKRGRPTAYNIAIAAEICDAIAADTSSLEKMCSENPHWPKKTAIYSWIAKHEDFAELYLAAKRKQAFILADEIIAISDDKSGDVTQNKNGDDTINSEFVARSKLRVDARKWAAGRLIPRIFGDLRREEALQEHNQALQDELVALRNEMDERNKKEY